MQFLTSVMNVSHDWRNALKIFDFDQLPIIRLFFFVNLDLPNYYLKTTGSSMLVLFSVASTSKIKVKEKCKCFLQINSYLVH